ncbi:MCE family protein [Rhodococcus sp. NPDC006774]|jgi:phospholipid/cholesterol/gamma-HCH transport system substrate-binding protein|uniref:MCE family protein n=1 Tax=Rhodococcus sp. NPDC006774 TaxID=3157186 RepID=UPI0033E2F2FB
MRAGIRVATAVCASAVLLTSTGCGMPRPLSSATGSTITITADLENAAGLYEGNEVAVLGMSVGTVDSIEAQGSHVRISMTVDESVQLPADLDVATISTSVVTDRHVELTPPYSGDGPVLEDGAHVPLSRTHVPVEIDRVLDAVTELSATLADSSDGNRPIADLLAVTNEGLTGNGAKIRSTLDDLSAALAVGVDNKDSLTRLITSVSELTRVAAENDTQIRGFSTDMAQVIGEAGDQSAALGETVAQINRLTSRLTGLIDANRESFPALFANLETTVAGLTDHSRELSETIDTAPTLFRNLENATDPVSRALRVHFLTDRTLFDTELVNEFCQRIQSKSEGCRTGRVYDFGPDFGISASLLGLSQP